MNFSKNIGYALEGDKSKFNTLVGNINKLEKEYNVNYPNIKNGLLKTKPQKRPLPVLPAKKTNEINPAQSITDSPKSGESIEVWDTKNKHLIAKRERKRAENKLYEAKLDLKRVEQKALEDGEITIEELGDVELAKMKVSPLEKNLMKAQFLEEKAKAEREAAFLKELESKGPEGMIKMENDKDFQLYTLENKVELTTEQFIRRLRLNHDKELVAPRRHYNIKSLTLDDTQHLLDYVKRNPIYKIKGGYGNTTIDVLSSLNDKHSNTPEYKALKQSLFQEGISSESRYILRGLEKYTKENLGNSKENIREKQTPLSGNDFYNRIMFEKSIIDKDSFSNIDDKTIGDFNNSYYGESLSNRDLNKLKALQNKLKKDADDFSEMGYSHYDRGQERYNKMVRAIDQFLISSNIDMEKFSKLRPVKFINY